jgi:hypothetical protein
MEIILQTTILLGAALGLWIDLVTRVSRIEGELRQINGRVNRLERR